MSDYLLLFFSSLTLFIILECTIYNTVYITTPIKQSLYNTFIVCCLFISFANLINSYAISFIALYIIFTAIGFVNYQMRFYRNEFLKPIDLKLFKESSEISKNIELKIPKIIFKLLPFNIIYVFLLSSSKNLFYNKSHLFTIILLFIFIILIQSKRFVERMLFIELDDFSDFNDFSNNCFLFTFFQKLNTFKLKTPKGYTKGISESLLSDIEISNPTNTPNIIVIMNESFFDVNKVKDLKLSDNPLKHFDEINNRYTNGNVLSPVIGGGTCQPEYEMLTGNSVIFTYKFKVAFLEFFKNKKHTASGIIQTLKSLNYSSVFIHPYRKEFYNRQKAYTSLGIDKIIDVKSFKNSYSPRAFISDKNCYEKVIEEFENRDETKPFFSMIVTMQNHPGYLSGELFSKHNIEVLNENISNDEKIMLTNYVNLLKESDDAIKFLTDYFSDKKDTVIMFFGDHQPSDNIGFSSITYRDILELSRTPFFIWDNLGLEKKQYKDISPIFLTPILLNSINIKSDKYFNYLSIKFSELKAFNTSFIIDKQNTFLERKNAPSEILELLNELELNQFDRIK